MIYMRNITITTAKSATYLENVGYIPIVVAMAAQQNVVAALAGGPLAIMVGIGATVACWALVPVVARIGGQDEPLPPLTAQEA